MTNEETILEDIPKEVMLIIASYLFADERAKLIFANKDMCNMVYDTIKNYKHISKLKELQKKLQGIKKQEELKKSEKIEQLLMQERLVRLNRRMNSDPYLGNLSLENLSLDLPITGRITITGGSMIPAGNWNLTQLVPTFLDTDLLDLAANITSTGSLSLTNHSLYIRSTGSLGFTNLAPTFFDTDSLIMYNNNELIKTCFTKKDFDARKKLIPDNLPKVPSFLMSLAMLSEYSLGSMYSLSVQVGLLIPPPTKFVCTYLIDPSMSQEQRELELSKKIQQDELEFEKKMQQYELEEAEKQQQLKLDKILASIKQKLLLEKSKKEMEKKKRELEEEFSKKALTPEQLRKLEQDLSNVIEKSDSYFLFTAYKRVQDRKNTATNQEKSKKTVKPVEVPVEIIYEQKEEIEKAKKATEKEIEQAEELLAEQYQIENNLRCTSSKPKPSLL